jgi:Xaa-Pro aminopeptidase
MADSIVFDKEVYKSRRDKFVGQVKSGKYLFLGNDETGANYRDNTYPFRQDSTFLYYFGINQPNLAVIIDADENKTILFGDEISIEYVIWMGTLPSLKSLAEEVGITEIMPYKKLLDYVSQDIQYLPPYRGDHYVLLQSLTGKNFEKTDAGISVKMIKAVVAQRSIKEAGEIELLEKAVTASNQMHRYIMTHARAGMKEYQLVGMAAQQAWQLMVKRCITIIMAILYRKEICCCLMGVANCPLCMPEILQGPYLLGRDILHNRKKFTKLFLML